MPRLRRFRALVAAIVGCVMVGGVTSTVIADPLDSTTTTTTTTAPSSTTSTTGPSSSTTEPASSSTTSTTGNTHPPLGGITQVTPPPSTTTTTQPGGPQPTTAPDDTTTSTPGEGDNGGANVPRGVVPADAQAIIDSYPRSPANSTTKLLAALQPLIDLGVPQDQAYQIGMGRFPVAGEANFVDDWLFPRWDGSFHFHHGTDIFAAGGTPIRAPADGVLRQDTDNLGGTVAYVKEADGTYYYMAHMSGYVAGQVTGQEVKTGDIVGYVGNSGDAAGGPTHCHFEVHPNGGEAVDPKPYLDQWLSDAIAAVPQLIASVRASKVPNVAPVLRTQVNPPAAFAAPAVPARSQLLWASSANPQGGALQLAEAVASEAAHSVDWTAEARRDQSRKEELAAADAWAKSVATPLLPYALQTLVDPIQQVPLVDHR